MSMIDTPLMRGLERVLDLSTFRQQVITSNLANVDTPGYHTRDVRTFASELRQAMDGEEPMFSPASREIRGLLERPDGNNVSVERESLLMAQNQLRFQVTAQFLRAQFRLLRRRRHGTLLEGVIYCRSQCLENALVMRLAHLQSLSVSSPPSNRMPLGLLMMARGKLTYNEVLAALEAQRRARYGKIGEWFEKLGFATEQEVTAALALQWGCPVASSLRPDAVEPPYRVPLPILEAFHMWPAHYVSATNTLNVAFSERVDHAALYAIEKMLDCRTQPCVAGHRAIAYLIECRRQQPRPSEVKFGPMHDPAEMARIASSYIAKVGAEEVRLRRLGDFIWLRLRARSAGINVLFRLRGKDRHPRDTIRSLLPGPMDWRQASPQTHAAH